MFGMTLGTVLTEMETETLRDPYDDYQNDYGYGDAYGNVMSKENSLLSYKC